MAAASGQVYRSDPPVCSPSPADTPAAVRDPACLILRDARGAAEFMNSRVAPNPQHECHRAVIGQRHRHVRPKAARFHP